MSIIKIIIGSSRPSRFGNQPAEWIMKLAAEHPEATFELIDLAEVNLPLLDEPAPALFGQYTQEHTKAWSKVIDNADGFIFITPEYNHATSAVLKNALDYLAAEWRHKPVAFVSYGVQGGIRAVENLRTITANFSMYGVYDQVNFIDYWTQLDENGALVPTEGQTNDAHKMLKNLIFWTDTFSEARQRLAK